MSYMDNSTAHLAIFLDASLLFSISPGVNEVWTSIWCA
jgi:hypothetical protein